MDTTDQKATARRDKAFRKILGIELPLLVGKSRERELELLTGFGHRNPRFVYQGFFYSSLSESEPSMAMSWGTAYFVLEVR